MTFPDSPPPLRLPRTGDPHLHAVEYMLNDLDRHGLRLERAADGYWRWRWPTREGCEEGGVSHGLGTAVVDALYWYFGLLPNERPL